MLKGFESGSFPKARKELSCERFPSKWVLIYNDFLENVHTDSKGFAK